MIALLPVWLEAWQSVDRERFLPSLGLVCDHGRAPFGGDPCLTTPTDLPDTSWLRGEIKAGRVRAFGELIPQYIGMSPADPRLDPYWSMAEEFDLPVSVHVGTGPPGAAYMTTPFHFPKYRAAYNDPMLLEEVLMRHKRLRLIVMHAGWPMLEQMVALLYAHPGVYVDVGVLQQETLVPRAAYYRHLRGLVEAGFGKRIMFGSDTPAGNARKGIDAILGADFLSAEQKSDILCGNAMRFLRLPESVCRVIRSGDGPIDRATVHLFDSGDSAVKTNAAGEFAVGGLADGLHVFEIAAVGYRPRMITVRASDSTPPVLVTPLRGAVRLDSTRLSATSTVSRSMPLTIASRRRDQVTEQELSQPDIVGGNALDAFAKLRPMLFNGRLSGGGSLSGAATRVQAFPRDEYLASKTGKPKCLGNAACDIDSQLSVSINEGPLGGPDILTTLSARFIKEMRYLSPADATARFGMTAGNGPVLVVYTK